MGAESREGRKKEPRGGGLIYIFTYCPSCSSTPEGGGKKKKRESTDPNEESRKKKKSTQPTVSKGGRRGRRVIGPLPDSLTKRKEGKVGGGTSYGLLLKL